MNKLVDSKQKIEAINNSGSTLPLSKMTFEERHKRLTIYLEHDIHRLLQEKRHYGMSQTRIINEALRKYFKK